MLARFGQLLRAIANGPDPSKIPAPQEVIPTMELGRSPASWQFPCDIFLYAGYASEGAGAARSQVCLQNPLHSGIVATVTRIECRTSTGYVLLTTDTINAGWDDDGAERARDTRIILGTLVTRPPSCRVKSDDAAQYGDAVCRMVPRAADETNGYNFFHTEEPWVLFPGSELATVPGGNGADQYTSFWWEERRFDPMEVRGTVRPGYFA